MSRQNIGFLFSNVKRLTWGIGLLSLSIQAGASTGQISQPWQGAYIGGTLAGIFDKVKLNAQHLGFDNMEGICNQKASFSSLSPGLELGYFFPMSYPWVLGVSGNYNYINEGKRLGCSCEFNPAINDGFSVRDKMQASLIGKLGYAMAGHFLPHINAGIGYANLAMAYTNEIGDNYSQEHTQLGWRAGAGIEWGFADHWSASLDYFYSQYQALNTAMPMVYGLQDPKGNAQLKLSSNSLQLGIKYWWDF